MIGKIKDNGFEIRILRRKLNKEKFILIGSFVGPYSEEARVKIGTERTRKGGEQIWKGKSQYARATNGYVLVTLKKDGQTFSGRSICSSSDRFNGTIGALKALSHALRSNNIKLESQKMPWETVSV